MNRTRSKLVSILLVLAVMLLPFAAAIGLSGSAAPEDEVLHAVPGWEDGGFQLYQEGGLTPALLPRTRSFTQGDLGALLGPGFNSLAVSINVSSLGAGIAAFQDAYRSYVNSHPEFFFVGSGYSYLLNGDNTVKAISPVYTQSMTVQQLQAMQAEFAQATNLALAAIPAGISDAEKVLAANDYLCRLVEYDWAHYNQGTASIPQDDYTAYGALVNQVAVCQGYALAFLHLMNQLGMECRFVGSQQTSHGWNMVKIGGQWYHVDVTLNDGNLMGETNHDHLLLSDSGIADSSSLHQGWDSAAPAATSTAYETFFWNSTMTPFVYHDGEWLYVTIAAPKDLKGYSFATGQSTTRAALGYSAKWQHSGGGVWQVSSYLHGYGDRLYYQTPDELRTIDLTDYTDHAFYTQSGLAGTQAIYDFRIEGDNGHIRVRSEPDADAAVAAEDWIPLTNGIVPVTGLTAQSNRSVTLALGSSGALEAATAPANATFGGVLWISLDPGVVTVSNSGALHPVSAGSAAVLAASKDGKFAERFQVLVEEGSEIRVTGVSLNYTSRAIAPGTTLQLEETVLPSDADDLSVSWDSSDPTVASVSSTGLVSAAAPGTATITATTTDGGFTAVCNITVTSGSGIAVTGVSLDETSKTVARGSAAFQLVATVEPADAEIATVSWTSSDPAVASVSGSGLVTPGQAGSAVITVTTDDGDFADFCTVIVEPIAVTGILLSDESLALEENETAQLTAEIQPANADEQGVTWESSDPAVATVSSAGLVTAVGAGTATITATADGNSGQAASCAVTVTAAPVIQVTGVSLSDAAKTLTRTESYQLTAGVEPANASNQSVTWTTSDPSVATVSPTGLVTAVGAGTATITVETADGSFLDDCLITVNPILPDSVTLSDTAKTLAIGGSFELTAAVEPNSADNKLVTWESSDPAVAAVSSAGEVTAVAGGTATITATTVNGLTATCLVTVQTTDNVPVTGVNLTPPANTALIQDDTVQLTAAVQPANATNPAITWSSTRPDVASVDQNGLVTAIGPGTAVIGVVTQDGNWSDSVTVTVAGLPVQSVSLDTEAKSLRVGDYHQLVAAINPANAGNKLVTWQSSDPSVASVDNTGFVSAVGVGTATVTVTTADGNKTAQCVFTVSAAPILSVPVTGVTLSPEAAALYVGNSLPLTAAVQPANADDQMIHWTTSNALVATVTAGVVTAVAPGTATITVTTHDGGFSKTCTITVLPEGSGVPVTGITLSEESKTVERTGTFQLTATVLPATATVKSVIWTSSDPAVATVSETGLVTAVGNGTAVITATTVDGAKAAICTVTVTGSAVTCVTLDQHFITLIQGEDMKLTATVFPVLAANRGVTWTSSHPAIASVDADGLVTALTAGVSTVTVTTDDGGKKTTCTVVVLPLGGSVPVKNVLISPVAASIYKGRTLQLYATVLPCNASNKAVAWASSNPAVATVDENGKVTALAVGEANITVITADGSKSAVCRLTVLAVPTLKCCCNGSAPSARPTLPPLHINVSIDLSITGNLGKVQWKSDSDCVIVSKDGKITAKKAGTATITASVPVAGQTQSFTVEVGYTWWQWLLIHVFHPFVKFS
jgi:uncharacterized protein YjdB